MTARPLPPGRVRPTPIGDPDADGPLYWWADPARHEYRAADADRPEDGCASCGHLAGAHPNKRPTLASDPTTAREGHSDWCGPGSHCLCVSTPAVPLSDDEPTATRHAMRSPVRQAAEVLSDQELADALAAWYRARQAPVDGALRDALRVHHPIMRSETGPFSDCRCGQVDRRDRRRSQP